MTAPTHTGCDLPSNRCGLFPLCEHGWCGLFSQRRWNEGLLWQFSMRTFRQMWESEDIRLVSHIWTPPLSQALVGSLHKTPAPLFLACVSLLLGVSLLLFSEDVLFDFSASQMDAPFEGSQLPFPPQPRFLHEGERCQPLNGY